jgi:hypothetical protein
MLISLAVTKDALIWYPSPLICSESHYLQSRQAHLITFICDFELTESIVDVNVTRGLLKLSTVALGGN